MQQVELDLDRKMKCRWDLKGHFSDGCKTMEAVIGKKRDTYNVHL